MDIDTEFKNQIKKEREYICKLESECVKKDAENYELKKKLEIVESAYNIKINSSPSADQVVKSHDVQNKNDHVIDKDNSFEESTSNTKHNDIKFISEIELPDGKHMVPDGKRMVPDGKHMVPDGKHMGDENLYKWEPGKVYLPWSKQWVYPIKKKDSSYLTILLLQK